ncbi:NAD(P)H:quinone oxidoreductase [Salipiger sp. P9]|uniref:NAD(P)H:quinone oxidoreductase n=1 Tax=Salipiger pentaromativorans TaxID=2943193 RepID=UPI0021587909|nr:NAD(P)H:quinone oxidoreductase [Salipiger pentaromativorans]MCR8546865.1 NAD(P)H:quinone oxidoreductase [Salipiger pentaromativorans]
MTKILVLYYSSYGHVRRMAEAVAEGARTVAGCQVEIARVPETVPEHIRTAAGFIADDTPVIDAARLAEFDGIVFGTPTRFGMMAAQMKQFFDTLGGLWAQNALVGKVGAVFASTGSQHGGHEATLLSSHIPLMHFGMVIAGLPYTFAGQTEKHDVIGGAPYGAGTIAGADGSLAPTEVDLAGARFQGAHVARLARALATAGQRAEAA